VTGEQLAFDCEPGWDDDRLYEIGAQLMHDPLDRRARDLWGQGLTAYQIHTMTTVPLTGSYL
jgi:hypothetical protein